MGVGEAAAGGRARRAQAAPAPHELAAVELALRLADPGVPEAVEPLLARARGAGDRAAEARLLEALGHHFAGLRDDDRAVTAFEAALEAEPARPRERARLVHGLALALTGRGDVEPAVALLRGALADAAAEPLELELLVRFGATLANVLSDDGALGEADEVLAAVLRHDRRIRDHISRVRLEWALARTSAEAGRLDVAEAYARALVERLGGREERGWAGRARLLLAGILLDAGRHEAAAAELAEAERLMASTAAGPDLALLFVERARLSLGLGDAAGARERARRALHETGATEPSIAGACYRVLAELERRDERFDEARRLAGEAIAALRGTVAPHYLAEAYGTLARIEEAAGDGVAALAAERRSLELAPVAPRASRG